MEINFEHKPVMLNEVLSGLNISPDGIYIDCTLGGGGHTEKILEKLVKKNGKVTGYELSGGEILNKAEAVALAKQGGIRGVAIASRNGNEYLRSYSDSGENNNLSNLPSKSYSE